jgi:hypothetical protein
MDVALILIRESGGAPMAAYYQERMTKARESVERLRRQ